METENCLPFRHATRLINAFQRDAGLACLKVVERDLDGVAVLLIALRMVLKNPTCTRFNVHAIAHSLKRPPETIRQAALRMVGHGFFIKHGRAIGPAPDLLRQQVIVEIQSAVVARMKSLVADFVSAGFPAAAGLDQQSDAQLCAAALDVYLSVYELAEVNVGHRMRLHVIGAITVLNAETLRSDPELGRRYGHDRTVPPPHLRRPASVAEITASTRMPYSTVWRHVAAAERSGLLRAVPDGYLLADRLMDDADISRRSRIKVRYVLRVLSDLARDCDLPPRRDQLG